VLERHGDASINFDVKLLSGTGPGDAISRAILKTAVKELFEGDSEIALFYFAGHGHIGATGGYLCGSDTIAGDDGLPIAELMSMAHQSKAQNKIIVLDSCYSGGAASNLQAPHMSELSEGMTILTASTANQYASEDNGSGVFTRIFVDGLRGAAANIVGEITPGSVYAHIDQSLGPWEQRPVFKTNVKNFVSLRKIEPRVTLGELRRLTEFFPISGFIFVLDPSYEPEREDSNSNIILPNLENTKKFAVLQKYNRVNLVVPVDAPHMYHAAMTGTGCKLTALGEHYRSLVEKGRI